MISKTCFICVVILVLLISVPASAQDQPFVTDANTVSLWHLDEISGIIAADSSGNNLHGDLYNGVAWDSESKFGGCVCFDYSGNDGQRVVVPDDPLLDISNVLTIDAWIYLRPSSDLGFIVSRWDRSSADPKGQFILQIATNSLSFTCANNTESCGIGGVELPFEQWLLVSAVFDNGQMALYIDGEQHAYGLAPFTSLTSGEFTHDELNIGDHWRDLNYPYTIEGKIDEVRISNIARYVITDIDYGDEDVIPQSFSLSQNHPNPFNPLTIIEYTLSRKSEVSLDIYNIMGQKVASLVNGSRPAGAYRLKWNGRNSNREEVTSGLYFYRLKVDDQVATRKMVLLK